MKNPPGTSRGKEKLKIPLSEFCLLKIKKFGTFLVLAKRVAFLRQPKQKLNPKEI